jgi:peptidoglycan/LPS O-acetylase OafA/YrhL
MTRASYFPNLDGMRFMAFFFVYLEHGFRVAKSGATGVSFFFVLSGFLITYLVLEEIDQTGKVDVGAFYVRRVLRIWPLYYATLLFAFVGYPLLRWLTHMPAPTDMPPAALYLMFLGNMDVVRHAGSGFLNVTWSVCVEEQFYLVWPLIFRFVPRRWLAPTLLAIVLGSTTFRAVHSDEYRTLYFHTFSVASDLAIGGLAALATRTSARFRILLRRTPAFVIVLAYAVALPLVWAKQSFGPFGRLGTALLFAFLLLEQNFARHSFYKMSELPMLSNLGKYTYGLYMLHMIVLFLLDAVMGKLGVDAATPIGGLLFAVLGLPLSILVAMFSFRYFESPFLRLKRSFARVK